MGLFDDMLEGGESLFRDEVALDYDFLPKTIPYREQEQQYIATCMKPLFSGRSGRNLFIHGPPGIGKTAAVRHVLRELEEKTDEIVPIFINCWQYNTSYKVMVEICEQLGYRFTQNKKTTELFKIGTQLLNKHSAVLVFDEIDKAEDFDFLYLLIEEVYRKSIFLITNFQSWLLDLDDRIRSRLMAELLEFKQYNAAETSGILKERMGYAFVPGVWEDNALEMLIDKTASIKDIRSGLFLLRESATLAEDQSKKKVMPPHVEKAIEKLDQFTSRKTEELDEESKFILSIVRKSSGNRIGDLFREYEKEGGKSSYKTFQRKITRLEEGKYINLTKKSGAGGNTTIVEKRLTDF
ncbi:MAG: Cdc6/Cdc18 family protein [Nanobdellota archaeon]